MKAIIGFLALMVLAGCNGEHYQIASAGGDSVWKIDTATGKIWICVHTRDAIKCSD